MAGIEAECCEMAEIAIPAPELWEDAYSKYEELIQTKLIKLDSTTLPVASKIRGIYVLIIGYFTTFPEFGSSQEAINLTLCALETLDTLRKTSTNDKDYINQTFNAITTIAMQVHTASLVLQSGSPIEAPDQIQKTETNKPASKKNENKKQTTKKLDHESFQIEDNENPKKRKVSGAPRVRRREVAVSNPIPLNNKFEVLATIEHNPETATSSQTVTHELPELDMETNDPTGTPVADRTVPKKEPRPPPITLIGHENLIQLTKVIKPILSGDLKVITTNEGFRFYTQTISDHRALKTYFEQQKKQYFTYQLRSEMPLRVMLRKLPNNVDTEDLKQELINMQYPVRSAKQITKKEEDGTITKYPLYLLELENTDKGREIYDLTRLWYTVVSVESYRPRAGLKQCYRCQRFGHTFAGCNLPPKCVICAGSHSHKDCPARMTARDDKTKLKCANCNEVGHPASFHGCKSYIAALENFQKPKGNKKNHKPHWEGNLLPKKLLQGCHIALWQKEIIKLHLQKEINQTPQIQMHPQLKAG